MHFPFSLPMILDGTGSCSDLTGEDPNDTCCEQLVLQDPAKLTDHKKDAVCCGVTALLSPTGGIMHSRLEELGNDDRFVEFYQQLTALVRQCAGKRPVGGVIRENSRPYEEYGDNAFESAYFDHLEAVTILKDAGVDFILLEHFSALWDMRAGVLAAKQMEMPVFAVIEIDEDGQTRNDTDYLAALITLQSLGADAFGFRCSGSSSDMNRLIKRAFPHAEIPLIADLAVSAYSEAELRTLAENGAAVWIDRSELTDQNKLPAIHGFSAVFEEAGEKDSYAAANEREAFFLPENLDLSEPLHCGYDLTDQLIDLDDASCNAVYFQLDSTDDAAAVAECSAMSHLPFVVHSDDVTTLEAVLRMFQGRLIVDSRCSISEELLLPLIRKYGAILY